jgi:hypothetical protein
MYFEKCVHVLRCHLLAKNVAGTCGVTHVQEEVIYLGTYLLIFQFKLSASHLTTTVVLLRMLMLVDLCCVGLIHSRVT